MNTVSKEFSIFAEKELTPIVMRFADKMDERRASQIARDIVGRIDWNSSALMHKGLSWMAERYLAANKMI